MTRLWRVPDMGNINTKVDLHRYEALKKGEEMDSTFTMTADIAKTTAQFLREESSKLLRLADAQDKLARIYEEMSELETKVKPRPNDVGPACGIDPRTLREWQNSPTR